MFQISLNCIRETVIFREGGESLRLKVNVEPHTVMARLTQAQKQMHDLNENSPEEEQKACALDFAGAIFGEEQAKRLLDFYHQNASYTINVCSQYLVKRLSKKIIQAQKRGK